MFESIKLAVGGAGVIALLCLLFLICPILFLWSINTLLEQAGSNLYIPHGFWSYLASFLVVALMRGGK